MTHQIILPHRAGSERDLPGRWCWTMSRLPAVIGSSGRLVGPNGRLAYHAVARQLLDWCRPKAPSRSAGARFVGAYVPNAPGTSRNLPKAHRALAAAAPRNLWRSAVIRTVHDPARLTRKMPRRAAGRAGDRSVWNSASARHLRPVRGERSRVAAGARASRWKRHHPGRRADRVARTRVTSSTLMNPCARAPILRAGESWSRHDLGLAGARFADNGSWCFGCPPVSQGAPAERALRNTMGRCVPDQRPTARISSAIRDRALGEI